jgi:histidinol-phosphate aminotransferase
MKSLDNLIRKNILKLKPYYSARDLYNDGIFLDANENAFGSTVSFDGLELNRYPDPHQTELRDKVSSMLGLSSKNIFFGVGSDEIIDLVIRIFCEPGNSNVIIPEPTYGMYKVACDINDIQTRSCQLDENFDINVESVLKLADKNTKIIFLCSPNNPTGNILTKTNIFSLADRFSGIVFVDEAYIDFSENNSIVSELIKHNNLIVSRTFSKSWGLAGLRCGYCIADSLIINTLLRVKAPYSINSVTGALVIQAVTKYSEHKALVKSILMEKEYLISELYKIGSVKNIYPSSANFILVRFYNADKIFNYLIEKGIRVRMRRDNVRLKDCIRITVGRRDENNQLIRSLKNLEVK